MKLTIIDKSKYKLNKNKPLKRRMLNSVRTIVWKENVNKCC